MTRNLDEKMADAVRADARRLEATADTEAAYPASTQVTRPNRSSRMFNLRLSEEQFEELKELAGERHLPMSTMARSWLLERLDHERRAS